MNNLKQNPFAEKKVHYKLVKSTRGWLTIGLISLGLATVTLGNNTQAQADSTDVTTATTTVKTNDTTTSQSNDDEKNNTTNASNSEQSNKATSVSAPKTVSQASDSSQSNATAKPATSANGANEAEHNSTKSMVSSASSSQTVNASAENSELKTSAAVDNTTTAKSAVKSSDSSLTSNNSQEKKGSENTSVAVDSQGSATAQTSKPTESAAQSTAVSYQIDTPNFRARWDATATSANSATPEVDGPVTDEYIDELKHDNEYRNMVFIDFVDKDGKQFSPTDSKTGSTFMAYALRPGMTTGDLPALPDYHKPAGADYKVDFDGWYYRTQSGISATKFTSKTVVNRSYTLMPKYTITYIIKYQAEDPKGKTVVHTQDVVEGDPAVAITPDFDGAVPPTANSRFVYWYADNENNDQLIAQGKAPVAYQFGIDKVNESFTMKAYYANVVKVDFVTVQRQYPHKLLIVVLSPML